MPQMVSSIMLFTYTWSAFVIDSRELTIPLMQLIVVRLPPASAEWVRFSKVPYHWDSLP